LIMAALAALPVAEKLGQGIVSAISKGVESLTGAGSTQSGGQNVPTAAATSHKSAGHAGGALSSGMLGALLDLQNIGHG
jgi:hypothetical protein